MIDTFPPAFFRSLTQADEDFIITHSYLSPAHCKRLWEILGREDTPPQRLFISIDIDEARRVLRNRSMN